jgi:hypothetical protein
MRIACIWRAITFRKPAQPPRPTFHVPRPKPEPPGYDALTRTPFGPRLDRHV